MSVTTLVSPPQMAHIAAAKTGAHGLIKSVAAEFASSGITANVIAPGLVDTPILGNFSEQALQEFASGTESLFKISCRFECDAPVVISDVATADHLYRIVQECLTNVHRHSGSRTAHIVVKRERAEVSVSIADEGRGISPDILDQHADSSATLGVGIAGMRERLGHLGGRLVITPRAPGTTVTGLIPSADRPVETDAASATSAGM